MLYVLYSILFYGRNTVCGIYCTYCQTSKYMYCMYDYVPSFSLYCLPLLFFVGLFLEAGVARLTESGTLLE